MPERTPSCFRNNAATSRKEDWTRVQSPVPGANSPEKPKFPPRIKCSIHFIVARNAVLLQFHAQTPGAQPFDSGRSCARSGLRARDLPGSFWAGEGLRIPAGSNDFSGHGTEIAGGVCYATRLPPVACEAPERSGMKTRGFPRESHLGAKKDFSTTPVKKPVAHPPLVLPTPARLFRPEACQLRRSLQQNLPESIISRDFCANSVRVTQ